MQLLSDFADEAVIHRVDLERLLARADEQLEELSQSKGRRGRLANYVVRMDELLAHVEKAYPGEWCASGVRVSVLLTLSS